METQLKVTAIRKDEEGNLAEFKLSDGNVVDFANCQKLINEGKLDLISTVGKNGVEVIRSKPNGDPSDNLSQLPEF